MKRNAKKIAFIALMAMLVMTFSAGCGSKKAGDSSKNHVTQDTEKKLKHGTKAGETFKLKKGSFVIPKGWKLHEGDSTDEKPFFVPENYSDGGNPDNISVQYDTNPYSKDDVDSFSHAILAQLSEQLSGYNASEVHASGFTSKQGYPVLMYKFTVEGDSIVQYYIIGDHGHIFIYESNYSGNNESFKASQSIIDSFKW